jgi:hypothetical protein
MLNVLCSCSSWIGERYAVTFQFDERETTFPIIVIRWINWNSLKCVCAVPLNVFYSPFIICDLVLWHVCCRPLSNISHLVLNVSVGGLPPAARDLCPCVPSTLGGLLVKVILETVGVFCCRWNKANNETTLFSSCWINWWWSNRTVFQINAWRCSQFK